MLTISWVISLQKTKEKLRSSSYFFGDYLSERQKGLQDLLKRLAGHRFTHL